MTAAGESRPPAELTHLDARGSARMVDVSAKPDTERVARATGAIRMAAATLQAIREGNLKKGDVLGVARIAGIMAGKRTAELVPLCHPVALHDLQVEIAFDEGLPGLRVSATARTVGKTGVEMEAIVAASVALITIYDMGKALDRDMVITDIVLAEKSGGVTRPRQDLDGTRSAR